VYTHWTTIPITWRNRRTRTAKLKLGKWEVAIFLFASMCGWKNTSAAVIIGVMAINSQRTMYAVEIRNGLKCAS
jgi:hypothetical protein